MSTAVASPLPADEDELYTFEEFAQMNFDERVELVEGKLLRMGWNNLAHTGLIAWLSLVLGNWAEKTGWGSVFSGNAGVRTKRDPDTTRGAGIACVSAERYPKVAIVGKVFERGPELLVEVVSPSNTWNDVQDKIGEYFAVGTDEVWVVSPKHKSVTVYTSPKASATFQCGEEEAVTSPRLPGFELPLRRMGEKIDQIGGLGAD